VVDGRGGSAVRAPVLLVDLIVPVVIASSEDDTCIDAADPDETCMPCLYTAEPGAVPSVDRSDVDVATVADDPDDPGRWSVPFSPQGRVS
jgi:hypothetical protein